MINNFLKLTLLGVGILLTIVGKAWIIISFLTFLFKDYDFDMRSVWCIVIGILMVGGSIFIPEE